MCKLTKPRLQITIFATFMSLSGKFIYNFSSLRCFTHCIAIIFIFFITNKGICQTKPSPLDSVSSAKDSISFTNTPDSLITDSLSKKDSLSSSDSSKRSSLESSLGIKISKDAMTSVINADAADSAVLDMEHNIFYLYKKVKVTYEDIELKAEQSTFDQSTNVISAGRYKWRSDTSTEKQTFKQGAETFRYESIDYNVKSKRAIVRNVHTQYGEGYMYSEQIKRNPDQTIYGLHSIYTTCALDTPHFGIKANRIKVIPGKVTVSGPANLAIENVPTFLWLPFGIFPTSQKQKSGFVLPTYTIEQARGLGLRNGGYYYYINDHIDLLTQADIYTKGSYAVTGTSNYYSMYHYRGALRYSYAYNKTGEDFEPGASVTKDFMVNWTHQSDPKAVPGQSFSASVQAGTSSFYSNNSYDPNQILNNQYASNITYAKNWQSKPIGLAISALHSQNTTTKQVNVTLPAVNFHVTQINPFQNKHSIGTHWYDKITASYTFDMLNRITFYDSTFSFARLGTDQFQSGIRHTVPVSASYTLWRYINVSFNLNYNEYWLNNKIYQGYNAIDQKVDSIQSYGFYTARDFSTGVSFSTRIYGMKLFKKGKLRGIRHVVTPSVGLSYHPDFGAPPFNYYYRTRLDSSTSPLTYSYLSPYASSIVGLPPYGKSGLVTLGLNNNLQIKVRSSKDTTTGYKNISLIDGFGGAISYNPAIDSFQWGNARLDFRTNVMEKVNISAFAAFDPYAFDYINGRRLQNLQTDNGSIARFTNANVAVGTNFHSKQTNESKARANSAEYGRVMRNAGYNDYMDFDVPWSFNISYALNVDKRYSAFSLSDTVIVSQSVTFQGEVQVTKRWKLNVTSGYNFDYKQMTLTSIDIYRDLHCWAMHLQTVPFGPRKSFNFTLNVKSAILQDLKLVKRRDYRDSPN